MLRIVLILLVTTFAQSQEKKMTQQATGPFDVKVVPQQPDSDVAKAQPARGRGRGYYRGSKPGGSSNDEDQPAAKLSKNE